MQIIDDAPQKHILISKYVMVSSFKSWPTVSSCFITCPYIFEPEKNWPKWKINVFTSLYLFTYHPSVSLFLAFLRNLMLKQIFCTNRSHLLQGGWQWSGPGSGADGRSLGDWLIFFQPARSSILPCFTM